jgi:hypothetical protein
MAEPAGRIPEIKVDIVDFTRLFAATALAHGLQSHT